MYFLTCFLLKNNKENWNQKSKNFVATTKMWWRRKRLVLERNELNSLIRLGNGLGKTLRSKQPDCLAPLRGEQKVHSTTNGILGIKGFNGKLEELAYVTLIIKIVVEFKTKQATGTKYMLTDKF